jgi:hypothetical protein
MKKRWLQPPFFCVRVMLHRAICLALFFSFYFTMFVVPAESVRLFHPSAASVVGFDHEECPLFLEYLGNLYEPLARFQLSQKEQAEKQWCDLTDRSDKIYLLLAEADAYSLWFLNNSSDTLVIPSKIEPSFSESLTPLVTWLLQTFWLVIEDLAGVDRARAFGRDVLASRYGAIEKEQDLKRYLNNALQPVATTTWQQGLSIVTEFQTLAARYVGRDCAEQVCAALAQEATAETTRLETIL